MALIHIDISSFRNLRSVQCQPALQGFNFIIGDNGSGKTSFLEAIYYLSFGKSFRSAVIDRVICHSDDKLSIFALMQTSLNQPISLGLERESKGALKLRRDGQDAESISEFAHLLPVQLIDSHCHHLLESGPLFRRKYLDWGVFCFSNDFLRLWRQYERALKQRNAALRGRVSKKELSTWDYELVQKALLLDQARSSYVASLLPHLEIMINELLLLSDLKISYYPGWDQNRSFQDILQQSADKDMEYGYTQYGPHKADLKIMINRVLAKDILSRGQQKMFVCAMILARGFLLKHGVNKRPIYLVDDLPSELDVSSRTTLLALLSKQEAQIFVTGTERQSWDGSLMKGPMKLFHVEHGQMREVME